MKLSEILVFGSVFLKLKEKKISWKRSDQLLSLEVKNKRNIVLHYKENPSKM